MKNNKLKKYMYNISDDIIAECAEFGPNTKQGGKTSSYYVDNVKKTGGSRTAAIAVFSVILFCALGILAALIINHNKRSLNGTPLNTAPESINSTPSTVTEDNQIMTTVKLFVPELLRRWIAEYEKPDYYQWAIELRELGEPIGSISVVGQNERVEMAHIGYCIGKPWWHRGYTSEALAAVIRYLFREVGVNRIETVHDPENPHSGGVMRKCGMHYEGTLRQATRSNRGITDAAMYSILANEYEGAKQG